MSETGQNNPNPGNAPRLTIVAPAGYSQPVGADMLSGEAHLIDFLKTSR